MSEERWIRTLSIAGREFSAECVRRPFREGLEVRISLPNDESISVAELGLGEAALLEKATALLREWMEREET
jgi:hypothetical protein